MDSTDKAELAAQRLTEIYRHLLVLRQLRDKSPLKGKCGVC